MSITSTWYFRTIVTHRKVPKKRWHCADARAVNRMVILKTLVYYLVEIRYIIMGAAPTTVPNN